MIHNASEGIPFYSSHFDAVYSHMFFNMRFTDDQLKYLFVEVNRVLKSGGLNLFSVRSDNDAMYKKGTEVEKNIYDINCSHKLFPGWAETLLGIFGFNRTLFGKPKDKKWWMELRRNNRNDVRAEVGLR
jgi:ubiquinone/menaquinone biosynthesis C-methylase UbiE